MTKKDVVRVITLVVLVLFLFSFLVMFVGCAEVEEPDEYEALIPATFAKVSKTTIDNHVYDIIVHVETGVLYVWNWGQYDSCMTPIFDADGKLMLYEDYIK